MNKNISIQLKAILLLTVFSMNTVIGFACVVGIDMGFNTKHHDEGEATETHVHVHTGGSKHKHHNKTGKLNHHEKKSPEKRGCCNDEVIKFQSVEKNLNAKTIIGTPAFVAIVSTFLGINLFNVTKASSHKEIIRFFYPPPPDILIAVQRFQI